MSDATENIAEGKAEVDREFKRNFIRLSDENYEKFVANLAERQHLRNVDDFYAAIGYGGISVIRAYAVYKRGVQQKLPFSGDRGAPRGR